MWNWMGNWNSFFESSKIPNTEELHSIHQKSPVPVIWLFGKTGSGKTSIVRYLTGANDAVIGQGFRPETRESRSFNFPNVEEGLVKFLDTRGLGEARYDPAEDIKKFNKSAHAMIVTVRINDHALDRLIDALRKIRDDAPRRPVILAVTCLHLMPSWGSHSGKGDPFENIPAHNPDFRKIEALPLEVREALASKQDQFKELYDEIVPIDFTHPDDGSGDVYFGGSRLKSIILHRLPAAYRHFLATLPDAEKNSFSSGRQQNAHYAILSCCGIAATVGATPFPFFAAPALMGVHAYMAYQIASIYEQTLDAKDWAALGSIITGPAVLSYFGREALKVVPILGSAVSAAYSFAFTYALGKTWDWYFAVVRDGKTPSPETMKKIFASQLQVAGTLWKAKEAKV